MMFKEMYLFLNKIAHKLNTLVKSIILSCRPRDEEDRIQKYCAAVERPTCPQWCKELDFDEVVSNLIEPKKPASFPKWTVGKDPCNCPTLIFHDDEYIRNTSLLLQDPVVVMPIIDRAPAGNVEQFRLWCGGSDQHTNVNKAVKRIVKTMLRKYMTTQYEYTATFHPEIKTNTVPVTEEQLRAMAATWGPEHEGNICFI